MEQNPHPTQSCRGRIRRRFRQTNRAVVGLLGLLATMACDPDPVRAADKKRDADMEKLQADVSTLIDAVDGPAEVDSRLRKSLVLRDGMVMIHNQVTAYGSYTFPATTTWSVQCGLGLTVAFGSSPRGDPADIGAGPEIHLSFGQFSPEDCDKLGFVVGEKLRAFMAGK